MASFAQQIGGLRCPSLSTSRLSRKAYNNTKTSSQKPFIVKAAVAISNAETRERMKLKEMFEDAYERYRTAPMEGVSLTIDDFHTAIQQLDFNSEIGTKVTGMVFNTDANGALVDITAKSSAYLPVWEASIRGIKHVEEAGIVPGLREEFVIIGENEADDSFNLELTVHSV